MRFEFAGHTDVGRVRARNEDALLQLPLRGIAAVADRVAACVAFPPVVGLLAQIIAAAARIRP